MVSPRAYARVSLMRAKAAGTIFGGFMEDLWEWVLIFAFIALMIIGFSFIGWLFTNVDRLLTSVLP